MARSKEKKKRNIKRKRKMNIRNAVPANTICSHISRFIKLEYFKLYSTIAENEAQMVCNDCKTSGQQPRMNLWMCLNCGNFGCGRTGKAHALAHYSDKKSDGCDIVIALDTASIWCYACDEQVTGSNCSKLTEIFFPNPEIKIKDHDINMELNKIQEDHDMAMEIKPQSFEGVVGLRNLGNTCYFNAGIQSLYSIPLFRKYLLNCYSKISLSEHKYISSSTKKEYPIGSELKKLFLKMMQANNAIIPRNVLSVLQFYKPSFRGYRQQDSEEAISALLDILDEQARGTKYVNRSIVTDLFDFLENSEIRCPNCGHVSLTINRSRSLILPIAKSKYFESQNEQIEEPGWLSWMASSINPFSWFSGESISLFDCLAEYFSSNDLDSDNLYKCDNCEQRVNANKDISISTTPEVLMIQLKRFSNYGSLSSKNNTPVSFDIELDLSRYFKPIQDYSSFLDNKRTKNALAGVPPISSQSSEESSTYRLISIVNQRGMLLGQGHYVSYGVRSDGWYEFDDTRVRPISEEKVLNTEAYILFYEKIPTNERRNEREKISSYLNTKTSETEFRWISREWMNSFLSGNGFPGPIDHSSILCSHGKINVDLYPPSFNPIDLMVRIPKTIWDYLLEKYDGNSETKEITKCDKCAIFEEELRVKKIEERKQIELQNNSENIDKDEWYIISEKWLSSWREYISAPNSSVPSPGPIDNTVFWDQDLISKKKFSFEQNTMRRNMKIRKDYRCLSKEIWKVFFNIYKGGPKISLKELDIYGEMIEIK